MEKPTGSASESLRLKYRDFFLFSFVMVFLFCGFGVFLCSEEVVRYFNKRIEEHLNASLADRTSLTYNNQCKQFSMFAFWTCGAKPLFANKRHSLVPVLGVADRVGRS